MRTRNEQQGAILARNLVRIMKEKEITIQELAYECKTDQSNISRYRNNRNYPGGQMLVKLADALNVSVAELIT